MAANIKKYLTNTKCTAVPIQQDNKEIELFLDLSVKFAMNIGHRQAIAYFMKTYELNPETQKVVMQYAKNKDPKLMATLK